MKKNATTLALAGSLALFSCLPVSASAADFGVWRTGVTANGREFFAYTENDSGQAFGEWCSLDSGNCTWTIGMSIGCTKDFAYPVLANSDTEAEPLAMDCSGTIQDTALSRYAFTDFSSVKRLLKGAHAVGFAMPMQADRFTVVRFSLNGCADAIAAMEAGATAAYQGRKSGVASTPNAVNAAVDSGRTATVPSLHR